MDIKIVIPSHKRADRILTTEVVPAIVCVPDSQYDQYRRHNPEAEIVCHPDSVIGLAAKRNWMYKHFGNIFMVDDDIVSFRKLFTEPGEKMELSPGKAQAIINETAYAAKHAGAFLFGFNSNPNPTMYKALRPIVLTGYVTGCATGILAGSKLWYNPEIICNEDYWISCLNAYYHRLIWKDMRFTFIQKDTFVSQGGLAEFRNIEAEKKDFELLQRCFGEVVSLKKDTKLAKRKHPYQKTLKLPY